ncbi:MAG: hypothetical protein GC164_13875 [Phycisphaera sp.]|nr:hypothetical protein [Phycisphaera sp.]
MVNVRQHFDAFNPDRGDAIPRPRLNVLLTEDRPREQWHWSRQLVELLKPMGVAGYVVHTGREALDLAEKLELHAAVIDLGTPLDPVHTPPGQSRLMNRTTTQPTGELWLLELLRRLPAKPPVVVIQSRSFTQAQVDRVLSEALRLGAFSVLNKPIALEQILSVFQRLLDRRYRGTWPPRNPRNPRSFPPDETPPSNQ